MNARPELESDVFCDSTVRTSSLIASRCGRQGRVPYSRFEYINDASGAERAMGAARRHGLLA